MPSTTVTVHEFDDHLRRDILKAMDAKLVGHDPTGVERPPPTVSELTGQAAGVIAVEPVAVPVEAIPIPIDNRAAIPAEEFFGPHIKSMALLDSTGILAVSTMNWDHNLYGLSLSDGTNVWQRRHGHYYGFEMYNLPNGLCLHGFDFLAAEGHHLYVLDIDGAAVSRVAAHGLQHRQVPRFRASELYGIDAEYAVATDGSWIVSSGNLGLVAWDRQGTRLWTLDGTATRQVLRLAGLGATNFVTVGSLTVTCRRGSNGQQVWQTVLATLGSADLVRASPSGALVAVGDKSKIYVLNSSGSVIKRLYTKYLDFAILPDDSGVVVLHENLVKYYTLAGELQWIYGGDDTMRTVAVSAAGLVASGSELGTVYVHDATGAVKLAIDNDALTVPLWLASGDLVLGNWMGRVKRLKAGSYGTLWSTLLKPTATDVRATVIQPDQTTTRRYTAWINSLPTPLDIATNRLVTTQAVVRYRDNSVLPQPPQISYGGTTYTGASRLLFDGLGTTPAYPYLSQWHINWSAEPGNVVGYLTLDTWRTLLTVTDITIAEDPNYPESWLRDLILEYWDNDAERWVTVMRLLSDSALHSHHLASPVTASLFRLVLPQRHSGNIRCGEIALHGTVGGNSHPDVAALRSTAQLFDERNDLDGLIVNNGKAVFAFDSPFYGTRYIKVSANQSSTPPFEPPFGESIRNWNFRFKSSPAAGEYRYLRFAVRGLAGTTSLQLAFDTNVYDKRFNLYLGVAPSPFDGFINRQVAASVPTSWTQYTLDFWDLHNSQFGLTDFNVTAMYLSTLGDEGHFDHIILGRTLADLY